MKGKRNMLAAELLKILACPWCVTRPEQGKTVLAKGELELQGSPETPIGLKCKQCGRVYGIVDGLPNFLVEEAKTPEKK
jgi:uncharacterized protein YbaR (Trm112 family)